MARVDIVYFNAGGGHRAAATALATAIREQKMPWDVRLLDLARLLDPQSLFRKATGFAPEDFYNGRLRRGWTLGLAQELRLLQGMIRLGHPFMVRRFINHWLQSQPDMVVSLIPNFNRALCESLHAVLPGRPYVTVLTDLADYPPNFWMEPDQEQHIVCGTPRAREQARAAGFPRERIHATSGMIISPDFYQSAAIERDVERHTLGLPPKELTGLVMFGAHGANVMQRIARELTETPLILVCGHNQLLAARLRKMRFTAPRVIVGFTRRIRYYMRLSDFLIGKPGPGTISEAVQLQLPVIVVRNSWTMPQERYNTQWVRERNVGLVLPGYRHLRQAISEMGSRVEEFRSHAASLRNRAVFEVPGLLAGILAAQPSLGRPHFHAWNCYGVSRSVDRVNSAERISASPIRIRAPGPSP